MELQEYKQVVAQRFMDLPEEEKEIMGTIQGTPVGEILGKILGPEMSDMSFEEPMPIDSQMKRAGLGAR